MAKILVVDDDVAIRTLIEINLKMQGHIIRGAKDGIEGFALAVQEQPELVILDVMMPGTDGFELRDLVNKARPELPVFLITGRHEFADQDQAPGASRRFFRKPFDAKALLAAVRDALRDNGNGG